MTQAITVERKSLTIAAAGSQLDLFFQPTPTLRAIGRLLSMITEA